MPYELMIVVSLVVVVVVVGVTVLCSIETDGSRRSRRRVDKDITTSPVPLLPTIPFEIDAVVTWVDSTNPKWRVQKVGKHMKTSSNRQQIQIVS